jgi:hypothetical protein
MQLQHGMPSFEVEFDKEGGIAKRSQVDDLMKSLPKDTSDVFVISHGWNNNMEEARDLYDRLFFQVAAELKRGRIPGAAGRRYAILGLLWPSKKFTDKELIASGAASGGTGASVPDDYLREQLATLSALLDDPASTVDLKRAEALIPSLEDKKSAREEFARILLKYAPKASEEGDHDLPTSMPEDVLAKLGAAPLPAELTEVTTGGAAAIAPSKPGAGPGGGAAGLNLFSGIKAGAAKLLNLLTYYKMKERAAVVGGRGVIDVLRELREGRDALKFHLIGHSFGGRLVAAAARGRDGEDPLVVDSLTLLQAAFSHFGFAQRYDKTNDGYFRRVVSPDHVRGPIIVTHSNRDWAVGVAYPAASRLRGQIASALGGGKNDPYGGIGRNGAQSTPESVDLVLHAPGDPGYDFQQGKLYNLNGDACIEGHSDIARAEVAYALLSAVACT